MKLVWGSLCFAICLLVFFLLCSWWVEKNNPYSRDSWVTPFFATSVNADGQIQIRQIRPLYVQQTPFANLLMDFQAILRIEGSVFNAEKPLVGSEQDITDQIHRERFDPSKPYVITGGHFPELYVRNLGIFYNALLDPRISTSQTDWLNRQRIALQTVATDLELLKQAGNEHTTFVPIGSDTFVGANFNTYPSDSLYAIVYTLSAAIDESFIVDTIPTVGTRHGVSLQKIHPLQTKQAAKQLLNLYKKTLTEHIIHYFSYVMDMHSGLIKKDITLASARDSMKRQSSFYDNVIAWATAKNAVSLGLPITCPELYQREKMCDFMKWKQKIIRAFWDDEDGLFIDDLSQNSIRKRVFTGEEFVVVTTGFFSQQNAEDKEKLFRMIQYVKKNNLDQPLPLLYATQNDPKSYYFFVRYFVPAYMGESIWSYLGQGYIESLLILSSDHPELLQDAKKYLAIYRQNIEKYGGYPELYSRGGNLFQTLFYKSVLHTGWVIQYEQAKMLFNDLKK